MAADPDLVGMLTREELVRKVTQTYTLERLAAQDVATALQLLSALAQVLYIPPLRVGPCAQLECKAGVSFLAPGRSLRLSQSRADLPGSMSFRKMVRIQWTHGWQVDRSCLSGI